MLAAIQIGNLCCLKPEIKTYETVILLFCMGIKAWVCYPKGRTRCWAEYLDLPESKSLEGPRKIYIENSSKYY
jgi:hypothetical protein